MTDGVGVADGASPGGVGTADGDGAVGTAVRASRAGREVEAGSLTVVAGSAAVAEPWAAASGAAADAADPSA